MMRVLICALVLQVALGGVALGTEKVPRSDTFQSLEQLLAEEDLFSPDIIWLDDELSPSDNPLMAYLDNDEVGGIDWSGPVNRGKASTLGFRVAGWAINGSKGTREAAFLSSLVHLTQYRLLAGF